MNTFANHCIYNRKVGIPRIRLNSRSCRRCSKAIPRNESTNRRVELSDARKGRSLVKVPRKEVSRKIFRAKFDHKCSEGAGGLRGPTGILGERDAIVKVKVILNYDLGWIPKSKQVPRRPRYPNRRDTEGGREGGKRKGETVKGTLVFPGGEGELVDSFSDWSFKNLEFASATRKLSRNFLTAIIETGWFARYSRDFNFFSAVSVQKQLREVIDCATKRLVPRSSRCWPVVLRIIRFDQSKWSE